MTTVSRSSHVTHSSVSGGDGNWDHRLNRLLEDLQESVVPPESRSNAGTEYKEYRMTSSTRSNDEPAATTEEKWVEYGTRGGGQAVGRPTTTAAYSSLNPALNSGYGPVSNSTLSSSSSSKHFTEKTVGFSSDSNDKIGSSTRTYGIDPGLKNDYNSTRSTQMEFINPANTTTVLSKLQSGPTSPAFGSNLISSSPKVERKEFYAKASYTTLIKGGPDGEIIVDEFPRDNFPSDFTSRPSILPATAPTATRPTGGLTSSSLSTSESRREFMSSNETRGLRSDPPVVPGPPLYTSTPIKTSTYSREVLTDRSVTPPPKPADGLKTPPLIRKMMQSNQQSSSYNKQTTTSSYGARPPPAAVSPQYPYVDEGIGDGPPKSSQYYTATTTRTETREREVTPVKRFPSPHPPREQYGEPPKRLDELLATFDESYTETSRIAGDGGGPHKSVPYGPGTHQIRSVRIDDNVQSRNIVDTTDTDLRQRSSSTSYKNPAYGDSTAVQKTENITGPPVYYPPGKLYAGEQALMSAEAGEKGKAKMKMERQYKAKEKSKSKHSESGGGGAVPVPVCLPVCCAAPCVIM